MHLQRHFFEKCDVARQCPTKLTFHFRNKERTGRGGRHAREREIHGKKARHLANPEKRRTVFGPQPIAGIVLLLLTGQGIKRKAPTFSPRQCCSAFLWQAISLFPARSASDIVAGLDVIGVRRACALGWQIFERPDASAGTKSWSDVAPNQLWQEGRLKCSDYFKWIGRAY